MKRLFTIILSVLLLLTPFNAYAKTLYAVDVSHHNEAVDYVSLLESGKQFVMIRLGYGKTLDTRFWENVEAAVNAEMPFGVYHYSYAENDEEAKTEAQFVLQTLGELNNYSGWLRYPVAYDLEDKVVEQLGREQINRQLRLFCNAVQKAGYVPMVYANNYWMTELLDLNAIKAKDWKIWYARYEEAPDLSSPKQIGETGVYADMWQYKKGDAEQHTLDENVLFNDESVKHIFVDSEMVKAPTVKAYGKREYTCSLCGAKKTVKIAKVKAPAKTAITKLTAGKKQFKADWKKKKDVSGYQLQYALNAKFTRGRKTVTIKSAATASRTIKKLRAKKKYYVRIRTCKKAYGKTYYADWSKTRTVKTKG